MTTHEFLRLLEVIRDQFDWMLEPDSETNPDRRKTPRLHIRGIPKNATGVPALDPLRAACYARTGKVFARGAWSDIADALGMEMPAAAALLAASNDRTWTGSGAQRVPAEHLLWTRRRMLELVGLRQAQDGSRDAGEAAALETATDVSE